MENEIFKQKMVLITGTMFIGVSAAVFLATLAAASANLTKSEGLTYGIPLLMANLLAITNAGILCCFNGGPKSTVVCRVILGLAIASVLLVFLLALGNAGP